MSKKYPNIEYPLTIRHLIDDVLNLKKNKIKEVTHKEIVSLRDSGKLIPGQQYRITDYVATTTDPESRSANHPFDIIVTADSKDKLNENARAIAHEGDAYFKNCNLAAWKLKYTIDNDNVEFKWALYEINGYIFGEENENYMTIVSDNDTTFEGYPYKFFGYENRDPWYYYAKDYVDGEVNFKIQDPSDPDYVYNATINVTKHFREGGKGVIYQMIDENNNEAQYDFKGIQFKRYKITTCDKNTEMIDKYTDKGSPDFVEYDENDYLWCYLFSKINDDEIEDFSVNYSKHSSRPRNNKFMTSKILLRGVIITYGTGITNCFVGDNSSSWTAGESTYFKMGDNCSSWIIGDECTIKCENDVSNWCCANTILNVTCQNGNRAFTLKGMITGNYTILTSSFQERVDSEIGVINQNATGGHKFITSDGNSNANIKVIKLVDLAQ